MKKSVMVRIHVGAKNKLILLSKNAKKSQTDYISSALEFVYNSGLDIYNRTEVNVPDAVKSLEKRIIGFMKKREADFFVPMNEKVAALTQSNVKLFYALEALDVVNYASDKFQENNPFRASTPEGEPSPTKALESPDFALELEAYKKKSEAEKKQMEMELEYVKLKAKTFKRELEFLMRSISKGGALSKGKFMHNIHQIDWRRIRKLLDDN